MKKILSLIAVFTAFAISVYAGDGDRIEMEGSFLRHLQKRDSVLIGDQLQYGVLLRDVKEGTRFAFPDYQGHLTDSVETVGSWIMDTVRVSKDKNLYDIQASIVVTSFEEGKHGLQPIYLLRSEDGEKIDTLVFQAAAFARKSDGDDLSTSHPYASVRFLAAEETEAKVATTMNSALFIGNTLPSISEQGA